MALLHPLSKECIKSELSLWSLPTTQVSVDSSKFVEYFPISTLAAGSPIEFQIPPSDDYIDLNDTLICVSARIVQTDGTAFGAPAAPAVIAPTKNWISSLFSSVNVYFGDKLVSGANSDYPYISYLETLLSYGSDAKKSYLECGLWVEEEDDAKNKATRANYVTASKPVYMLSRLHVDLFKANRLMINQVGIKLTLTRSKDAFAIESTDPNQIVKVDIRTCKLLVKKVKPSPNILNAHAAALLEGSARYPFRRIVTKVKSIPAGVQSFNADSLFMGVLPERIILGMVKHTAYNGTMAEDPFNFEHFNLSYISLNVNGESTTPLLLDFQHDNYIEAYHALNRALGIAGANLGNTVTRNSFASGSTLFVWDLSADLSAGDPCHGSLQRNGVIRPELKFWV